jgi:hypothetical protein
MQCSVETLLQLHRNGIVIHRGLEDSSCQWDKWLVFWIFCDSTHQTGEEIKRAPTALGVSNRQTTTHCYNCSQYLRSPELKSSDITGFLCCPTMRFYGAECRNIAGQTYHKTLCGKDFGSLYMAAESAKESSDSEISALLWLQLLACCVQECGHPLEMHLIARLIAHYDIDINVPRSFRCKVVTIQDILQSLDINIFANARYDGWVIETIW